MSSRLIGIAPPRPLRNVRSNERAGTADFSFTLSVCIPLSGVDEGFTVGVSLRRLKKAGSSDCSVGQFRPGRTGRCSPRASIARAIRASGERNPNAMRVRSRILVLVDSISPLDRPWSKVASMAARFW